MKRLVDILLPFILMLIFSSCGNPNKISVNDSVKNDTNMYDITRPIGNNYLEDLLEIKDEADLKLKYPSEKITYDTIWGPEGSFEMGTFMSDQNRKDFSEVKIIWKDSLHRSGVSSVMIEAPMVDTTGAYVFNNPWTSRTGIKLGMTTDELEKINGRPFSFSGFDWDYGGGAGDWKKGTLENAGVGLTLSVGGNTNKLSEKEMSQIEGDQTVMSDNSVVKKIQPVVVMISVFKR